MAILILLARAAGLAVTKMLVDRGAVSARGGRRPSLGERVSSHAARDPDVLTAEKARPIL